MDTATLSVDNEATKDPKPATTGANHPPSTAESVEFCDTTMPPLNEAKKIVASTSGSKKEEKTQTPSERLKRR